ncbi:MAG: sodium ion-translocating decarboxylase subunit beta [Treponema porcinum]|nr:sodium ion-translocating decarboxylase subunit beta [Treponema porcinum]MCI6179596.1 sodium ion-translocating decarboxylase subunit beta [Treponema porcinum]MCI6322402.1 sodium ion-translocating decarboxylase subunit beta [Treponema porcinum]MCI7079941.1 sodium ion-translocating decarboxylase subunit beta [Treponema porcinum]MCI7534925.1 sodium ion-translocating decarboxylase subunit beta [Treponema porcinum]MDY5049740.1 sodium ion-translocating decarboxylase subunit beta [Treponema porcinu
MTAVFLLAAAVISFGSTAFADNGAEVASFRTMNTAIVKGSEKVPSISVGEFIKNIGKNTGIYKMIHTETPEEIAAAEAEKAAIASQEAEDPFSGVIVPGWQKLLMLAIGFLIVYLGAAKGFEPLLLIPIGFGTILVNIPGAGMGDAPHGMLHILYSAGVGNEFFPMLIFMGIGAMTDFGPLIANPKMALLGGAAQLGIFATLFGVALMNLIPGVDYNMLQACAIAIIGGADGPTSIYVSGKLAPEMMAVIAVAAYSYMALVPMIQPPIMKMLTTRKERLIRMKQLREVSRAEKVLFPLLLLVVTLLFLPPAAPLIGMLAFGNFVKEIGCVERLSNTIQNELMNIVSILLSLGVGSQMTPEKILNMNSIGIIILGLVAFIIASAGGILMAKFMNLFLKEKINPLIGSAGVSAVPMAARVSNKVGQSYDPMNFLLMHAMGPNVAGVIGTAIAAGVFISTYGH